MTRIAMAAALAAAALWVGAPAARADGFTLLTAEEYAEDQAAGAARSGLLPDADGEAENLRLEALDGPTILVVSPDLDQDPLAAPIDLEMRFRAGEGRLVDPATLKILYGWLGLDITDRILPHATLTADGLSAQAAALPAGRHSITVRIRDDAGDEGERRFRFRIAD